MRSFDLSDAFAHPSAGDSRASRVARGRGGRAPRVQDRSGPWVDQGRRALAGLRPRLRRRGRLESRHLRMLTPALRLASGESVAGTLCRALAWQVVQGRLRARYGRRTSSRRALGHQARRHPLSFRRREPVREHSTRCAQPLVSTLTPLAPNLTPIASSFGRWLCQVTLTGVCDRCFTSGDFDR